MTSRGGTFMRERPAPKSPESDQANAKAVAPPKPPGAPAQGSDPTARKADEEVDTRP
jgi:hypothetical protein